MEKAKNAKYLLKFLGVVLIFVAYFVFMQFQKIQKAESKNKNLLNWGRSVATITESRIEREYRRYAKRAETTYYPIVQYSYVVNGQQYSNHMISFLNPAYSFKFNAEEKIRQYSVGSQVMIYYNPDAPEESIIEPYESGYLKWGYLIGIILLGAAGGFLIFGDLKKLKNSDK